MRPTTILALVIGTSVIAAAAAEARTPRRVCRQECAPRLEEQCGALAGAARKQCRRGLVRACRATTPAAACTDTAAMTALLADRSMPVPASAPDLRAGIVLCADRRFGLSEGSDDSVADSFVGGWTVVLADGALVLALDGDPAGDAGAVRRFALGRADDGALTIDGTPAEVADATAACARGAGGERIDRRAVVDALANTTLEFDAEAGSRHAATLCGTGGARLRVTDSGVVEEIDGNWSVQQDADGLVLALELDDPVAGTTETRTFALALDDDGTVRVAGRPALQSDARQACGVPTPEEAADLELGGRLKGALRDRVLVTVRVRADGGRRTSLLVLCAAGTFQIEVTDSGPPVQSQTTVGTFAVAVEGGAATLVLTRDGSTATVEFDVALDDAGDVLLDGVPATIGDAGLVAQVCG